MEEKVEATISNMFAYEVITLAYDHLAKMIEYPSYDDWGNNENEIKRAKYVIKRITTLFPSFANSYTQKALEEKLETAEKIYLRRCEMEHEMLRRRLEFGKVTLDDVKGE